MSEFVDANVFVRLLSGDDPTKAANCLALFERAERDQVHLFTSETIVAEVVYVLSSRALYNLPRTEIVERLRPLLEAQGLSIEHKESVLDALTLYEYSNLDFVDCLAVQHVSREGLTGVYSYDRDFDRIPGVRRLEP